MKKVSLTIIIALLFVSGCANEKEEVDAVSQATLERYDVKEVREYKGINLDPAKGARDNSIKGIQHVNIDEYLLTITGLVDNPLSLNYDEVLKLPSYERVITLYCVEGWDATILWEGVKISEILENAKTQEGANTVIFKAVDGYTTSIPISTILERDMLLGYKANDIVLPDSLGFPFIVIAEDKLGYKWARWVNEIELSSNDEYQGYWEKRGYSNNAEL